MATGFKEDSPAVQAHLEMMQQVIGRMAANSTNCKAWAVAAVSAILVVAADKKPEFSAVALLPAFMFWMLDGYYLSLEKSFREAYNHFVEKVHQGKIEPTDLFHLAPAGDRWLQSRNAFFLSFSIWPFYVTLAGTVFLVLALFTGQAEQAANSSST